MSAARPQLEPLNLAGEGLRQFGHELEPARHFETRQLFPQEVFSSGRNSIYEPAIRANYSSTLGDRSIIGRIHRQTRDGRST